MYPDDSFSFNHDFSSAMQKIKISTISSRVENKDERKETRDRIDEERKHQVEVIIASFLSCITVSYLFFDRLALFEL